MTRFSVNGDVFFGVWLSVLVFDCRCYSEKFRENMKFDEIPRKSWNLEKFSKLWYFLSIDVPEGVHGYAPWSAPYPVPPITRVHQSPRRPRVHWSPRRARVWTAVVGPPGFFWLQGNVSKHVHFEPSKIMKKKTLKLTVFSFIWLLSQTPKCLKSSKMSKFIDFL